MFLREKIEEVKMLLSEDTEYTEKQEDMILRFFTFVEAGIQTLEQGVDPKDKDSDFRKFFDEMSDHYRKILVAVEKVNHVYADKAAGLAKKNFSKFMKV